MIAICKDRRRNNKDVPLLVLSQEYTVVETHEVYPFIRIDTGGGIYWYERKKFNIVDTDYKESMERIIREKEWRRLRDKKRKKDICDRKYRATCENKERMRNYMKNYRIKKT